MYAGVDLHDANRPISPVRVRALAKLQHQSHRLRYGACLCPSRPPCGRLFRSAWQVWACGAMHGIACAGLRASFHTLPSEGAAGASTPLTSSSRTCDSLCEDSICSPRTDTADVLSSSSWPSSPDVSSHAKLSTAVAEERDSDWSLHGALFGLDLTTRGCSAQKTELLTWEDDALCACLRQTKPPFHRAMDGRVSCSEITQPTHDPRAPHAEHATTENNYAWIIGECKFLRVLLLRFLHNPHLWQDAKNELIELAVESVSRERSGAPAPTTTPSTAPESSETAWHAPSSATHTRLGSAPRGTGDRRDAGGDGRFGGVHSAHGTDLLSGRIDHLHADPDRLVFFGPGMRQLFDRLLLSADASTFNGSAAVWCAFALAHRHNAALLSSPQRSPFSFGEVHPTVTHSDLDRRRCGVSLASLTSHRSAPRAHGLGPASNGWYTESGGEAGLAAGSQTQSDGCRRASCPSDGPDGRCADSPMTSRVGDDGACTPAGTDAAVRSVSDERALNERLFGKIGAEFAARVSGHEGIYVGYHVSTIPCSVYDECILPGLSGQTPTRTAGQTRRSSNGECATGEESGDEREEDDDQPVVPVEDAEKVGGTGVSCGRVLGGNETASHDANPSEAYDTDDADADADAAEAEMRRAHMYRVDHTHLSILDPLGHGTGRRHHAPSPLCSADSLPDIAAGSTHNEGHDVQLTELWSLFQATDVSQLIDGYIHTCQRLTAVQRAVRTEMAEQLAFRLLFFSLQAVRAVTAPAVTYARLWTLHRELCALLRVPREVRQSRHRAPAAAEEKGMLHERADDDADAAAAAAAAAAPSAQPTASLPPYPPRFARLDSATQQSFVWCRCAVAVSREDVLRGSFACTWSAHCVHPSPAAARTASRVGGRRRRAMQRTRTSHAGEMASPAQEPVVATPECAATAMLQGEALTCPDAAAARGDLGPDTEVVKEPEDSAYVYFTI